MLKPVAAVLSLALIASLPAAAHHGWGSYDPAPITVEGKILTLKFENPHATITVQGKDKVWTVTLAPTSRMLNRGAPAEMVAVDKTVAVVGYASKVDTDEMRAERITVDGKTVEMR